MLLLLPPRTDPRRLGGLTRREPRRDRPPAQSRPLSVEPDRLAAPPSADKDPPRLAGMISVMARVSSYMEVLRVASGRWPSPDTCRGGQFILKNCYGLRREEWFFFKRSLKIAQQGMNFSCFGECFSKLLPTICVKINIWSNHACLCVRNEYCTVQVLFGKYLFRWKK